MGNYRILILSSFFTVWSIYLVEQTYAQIGARNTVPETISSCYRNSTAYDRYKRQPMHIENLIAIIRKIEQKDSQWDMRRIARTLVNRYMFDGIEFTAAAKPEYQFNPKSEESIKTAMIKSYIPIPIEEVLPTGVLDNDEMCALHWMLSHSMNATARDEELGGLGYNPGTGYNSNGNPGTGYNNPGTGYNNNPGFNSNDGNNGYQSGYRRGKRWISNVRNWIFNETDPESQEISNSEDTLTDDSKEIPNDNESNPSATQKSEDQFEEDSSKKVVSQVPPESEESESLPVFKSRFLPLEGSELKLPSDTNQKYEAGSPKFARQVSQNDPGKTRRPIETGVVYTKWGSISAGRLIAGIAAGLEPIVVPVTSGSPYAPPGYGGSNSYNPNTGYGAIPGPSNNGANPFNPNSNNPFGGSSPGQGNSNYNPSYPSKTQYGRRKRRQTSITFQPLQNIYAVTLAGDVGQAAILNGQFQLSNVAPPRGLWNDTICPREYILEPHPLSNQEIYQEFASWSYLTESEIRGGMDGLIIGMNIGRWDPARTFKLSEILSMYYSESGMVGEPQYRACSRGSNFNGAIDPTALREQSRSFAFLFNNNTNSIPYSTIEQDPSTFLRNVDEAYQRMSSVASNVGSTDPICKRRQSVSSSAVDTDDNLKYTEVKSRIYAVLDHTATYAEIDMQKRFLAQLAQEINVSPKGSRLGVVDGNSGMMLISPNYTDNSAILSCNIIALPTQMKTQDNPRVLNTLKSELEKLRSEEERTNNTAGSDLGIIILFVVQGKKLEESQKGEINRLLREINSQYADVQLMFTSSKYQQSDFNGFALNPERDFIKIQGVLNISDFADEFTDTLRQKSHGRLTYTKCNANKFNQDEEHKIATNFFVTPDTIQYYKISPQYFHSAKNLRLRFTSDNGKVRICQSRSELLPNSKNQGQNGVSCKETSGTYINPGNSQLDVEFSYSKPCGKHGDLSGCGPIYYSFTPTSYPSPGQVGLDCSIEGCQSSNQVKVTFTHWDMRCNTAFRNILSLPMALTAVLISLLFWKTST